MIIADYKKAITTDYIFQRENLRSDIFEIKNRELDKLNFDAEIKSVVEANYNIFLQIFFNIHKLFENVYLYYNPNIRESRILEDYKSAKLNSIARLESRIKMNFDNLISIEIFIKDLMLQDKIEEAKKIQDFILLTIDKFCILLSNTGLNPKKLEQHNELLSFKDKISDVIKIDELFFSKNLRANNPDFFLLIKQISKEGKSINEAYNLKYEQILKSFGSFFDVNGIIRPVDSVDFFSWISIVHPDESLEFIVNFTENPNNFKKFHEYRFKRFNGNWTDEDEFKYYHNQIDKIQLPIDKHENRVDDTEISEKVKKHFEFFNKNCPRKQKQILNDKDFDKLIQWTIYYFENDFKVPEISESIKVVNTNKTFVQLSFRYLFKELHKSSSYPITLFEFYKSAFSPFSEDKRSNFQAAKNNNEVKKLMQIDY